MNNVKIVKQDKNWIYFSMESINQITRTQAQANLPFNYDFLDFTVHRDPVLMRYRATWKCPAVTELTQFANSMSKWHN